MTFAGESVRHFQSDGVLSCHAESGNHALAVTRAAIPARRITPFLHSDGIRAAGPSRSGPAGGLGLWDSIGGTIPSKDYYSSLV
jgi:hypothetical protein